MGSYKIELRRSAEEDLRKISPPKFITNILKKIESLPGNPFPRQSLKLSGEQGMYRMRVGDYRVIYEVDQDSNRIVIHYIRHRKDVYRKFK